MDTRSAERFNSELVGRPELVTGSSQIFYPGMRRLKEDAVIVTKNKSHVISAKIAVPEGGANGVLIAQGGTYGGWAVYLTDGKLAYACNVLGIETFKVLADSAVEPGSHELAVESAYDGGGLGKGGDVTLAVDGTAVGSGRVERTLPFMFSMDETADIGSDTASPVSDDYPQTGSEFTGTIDWVRIDIGDDAHDHLIDPDHLMHIAMVRQ